MSLTEAELRTLQHYDRTGVEWVKSHGGDESFWSKELAIYQELMPGGKVIEIGPGRGKEAKTLLDNRYEYVGIEPSSTLIGLARELNPDGTFVKATVYDLKDTKERFDGFLAFASLLHVPKSRIDEALQSIGSVLHPAGIGIITLKEGSGEKLDPETGRTFSYYDMGEFYNILRKNGFGIVRSNARNIDENLTWLVYYVQKR